MKAVIDYNEGDEFNYSYSVKIDAMYMLLTYGMAFDNSPFGKVTMGHVNFLSSFSESSLKLCQILTCIDPRPLELNENLKFNSF